MNRRRKLTLALGAAALGAPLAALAQQRANTPRIGFLSPESPSDPVQVKRLDALRSGLRELGYVDGKSVVIEVRWADGNYDRLQALAAELAALKVDAIVVSGTKGTLAARRATTSIPIVMGSSGDPIALAVTTSLARPSGNVTGWTFFGTEVASKVLELLMEAAPRIARMAYLVNPAEANYAYETLVRTAGARQAQLSAFEVRAPAELERAFAQIAAARCDGLMVQGGSMFAGNMRTIAGLALKHRLPSGSPLYDFAEAGGLLTYGPDRIEGYRRAAFFVDRIVKGAKPAELPIEQASKFEFFINMATAKSLGLAIPPTLQSRARLI